MEVTVVDDFRDEVNFQVGEDGFAAHRQFGVRVITTDAIKRIHLRETSDVMACFASIEHYHNSPKTMLHSMLAHLKRGGLFALSAPNAVDVMKRIETMLGRVCWSPMNEWYEAREFRGHVREASVADMK